MQINGYEVSKETAYNGDVLGVVGYDVKINVRAKDPEEAHSILESLLGALRGAGADKPPVVAEAKPAQESPKPVKAPKAKPEPEEEPEPEAKPAKKPKAKPEPEPEEEEEEEEPEDEDDDLKPTVKVTKALKEATKLREVLQILMEQGIDSKKKLLKECKALVSVVPLLERIDLDKRVPQAVDLINPDIGD